MDNIIKEQLQKAQQDLFKLIVEKSELTVHRDKLAEELRKAEENKIEMHAAYLKATDKIEAERKKAEADKAEAVRIAVDVIESVCEECRSLRANICEECAIFGISEYKKQLESLTGRTWEELRG